MGAVEMKSLARNFICWPGIDREIEEIARSCKNMGICCYALVPNSYGPFMNNMFLIVDSYSKCPEVIAMNSTTIKNTIKVLREIFSRYGIQEQVVIDNGPQFVSNEIKFFIKSNVCVRNTTPKIRTILPSYQWFGRTIKYELGQLSIHLLISATVEHGRSAGRLFLKRMPKGRRNVLIQIFESKAKLGKKTFPEFEVNEVVLVRDHFSPNRWIEGEITEKLEKCFYNKMIRDKRVWRR
ncbi:K02A2.6-like [Cordylochernes scorpioides]|uniref:K02A2.6-like n=1 Tax=Cordylochernes scorpioides TaxID=51811 RepID=A0ABY6KTV4_9ARAC|nr:K02A2.6-like [Cordylochernes scorpioides]